MATLIRGDGRTVNAYQDSILGDFAFSGKDGIVKNVGQACGLDTTTLNSVKVKSGMVVIQGRQITLDGTDTITLPVATGSTVYWTTLYLELDLSALADDELTGKVTLKKLEYTSSYPTVPTSDNLKIQTAGKAYLGLYRFKNTANGITSSEQLAEVIDSKDILNDIQAVSDKVDTEVQNAIEELNARLDELGFKVGSVPDYPAGITLTAQAKYAILTIPDNTSMIIPYEREIGFTAKNTVSIICYGETSNTSDRKFSLQINGNILSISSTASSSIGTAKIGKVQVGFEIE